MFDWFLLQKYESTIDQELVGAAAYSVGAGKTLCVHSPGGNTFLREMTSWPPSRNYDVKSKTRLRQSMRFHVKDIPAKFNRNPT